VNEKENLGSPLTMSASKRVLIVGGSGRTGKLVIDELLERGHEVTALVRKPESLEARPNLRIVAGTPLSKDDVRKAFTASNPEVVVVTLSAPRAGDSPFAAVISPPRLMADSNANLVAVMKEFNTQKIVIMQALGVAESWANMHWTVRMLMKKSNMIYQYDDHNLVTEEVKASGENYVFVRPTRLEDGEAKEVKEWADDGRGVPMMSSCTRISVAKFMAEAVANRTWDNTAPVITN
jgi:putative NADH-flavin reductase